MRQAYAHEASRIFQAQILRDVDSVEVSVPDADSSLCERFGDRARVDSAQADGYGGHAPVEAPLVADAIEV